MRWEARRERDRHYEARAGSVCGGEFGRSVVDEVQLRNQVRSHVKHGNEDRTTFKVADCRRGFPSGADAGRGRSTRLVDKCGSQVSGGKSDEVQVEAPASMLAPFHLSPPAPLLKGSAVSSAPRQLVKRCRAVHSWASGLPGQTWEPAETPGSSALRCQEWGRMCVARARFANFATMPPSGCE